MHRRYLPWASYFIYYFCWKFGQKRLLFPGWASEKSCIAIVEDATKSLNSIHLVVYDQLNVCYQIYLFAKVYLQNEKK